MRQIQPGVCLKIRFISTVFGLGLLGWMVSVGWAEPEYPKVVEIRLEPKTSDAPYQLVFQVDGGAFDPILNVNKEQNGQFRTTIEGEGVITDKALPDDVVYLEKQIKQRFQTVTSVRLIQRQTENLPVMSLLIEAYQPLRPQIRTNTGQQVTITFLDEPVDPKSSQPSLNTTVVQELEPDLTPITLANPLSEKEERTPALDDIEPEPRLKPKTVLPSLSLSPSVAPQEKPDEQTADTVPVARPTNLSPTTLATTRPDSTGWSIYMLATHPDAIDQGVQQAWHAYQSGQLDSAQALLETHLGKRPDDHPARYLLALVHVAGEENQRAAIALQRLMTMDNPKEPWVFSACLTLIHLNIAQGHFSETDELLKQALTHFPNHPDLLYAQGLLLEAQNKTPSAKQAYLHVLQQNPNHTLAHYRLAITALKENQPQAAAVELKQILLTNPDDITALKALGYAYHRDQQLSKATNAYRKALKPDVLINFAGMLQEQGRTEDAWALYQAAEIISPDDLGIQYNLGMIYAEINRKEAAIHTLKHVIELAREQRHALTSPDERLSQAEAKLRALGATPPQESWLEQSQKKSSVDYQFSVSTDETASSRSKKPVKEK